VNVFLQERQQERLAAALLRSCPTLSSSLGLLGQENQLQHGLFHPSSTLLKTQSLKKRKKEIRVFLEKSSEDRVEKEVSTSRRELKESECSVPRSDSLASSGINDGNVWVIFNRVETQVLFSVCVICTQLYYEEKG
jgi:hypothetical protein